MGILLSLVVPFTAFAETSGDFEYEISNGEATITGYTGSATKLTIPSSLGGYPVTTIGEGAFYDCKSLTSVTIPNSVTTIGDDAFYRCYDLTSVTIPNSVTTIGEHAFYTCQSMTTVTIPNSVTTIGDGAFSGCHSLSSVTIPDSVTTIGKGPFSICKSLTSIIVDGKNANYCDVDGVLFNKAKTKLVQYPRGKTNSTYLIPNSVTTIGYWAFSWCDSLTSVTIPNSVTTIGEYAFSGCESLTSVTIPDGVTTIRSDAFFWHGIL
ncbi:MAG: leucine-rich repeat domain-containing protein [Clostridia bacterium]|nr:leucine-rich repeat domain-containing protein [Clostridia bacterium]